MQRDLSLKSHMVSKEPFWGQHIDQSTAKLHTELMLISYRSLSDHGNVCHFNQ